MTILPMWAIIIYFVVLGLVLILAEMSNSARVRKPPARRASRLWSPAPRPATLTRIPPHRAITALPPTPAPETIPIPLPDDTMPLALVGPDQMIRPYARNIPIPSKPVNGNIVICPLCGGGRLSGRILLPPRPGCIWCSPASQGGAE